MIQLVQELYVNLDSQCSVYIMVIGKEVCWTAEAINEVYTLPKPHATFNKMMATQSVEQLKKA